MTTAKPTTEIERLRDFVAWALREGAWSGGDLNGGDIQDIAEQNGLIRKVPYDPDAHGPNDVDAEPGDDWYVLAWEA